MSCVLISGSCPLSGQTNSVWYTWPGGGGAETCGLGSSFDFAVPLDPAAGADDFRVRLRGACSSGLNARIAACVRSHNGPGRRRAGNLHGRNRIGAPSWGSGPIAWRIHFACTASWNAIALSAAVSPWLIDLASTIYIGIGGQESLGLPGPRPFVLLAAAVMSVPTFLMGGTLPAAVRSVHPLPMTTGPP